ncbi:MAG: DUF934 domain-containing protein [Pseudomonadota bacterium]
MPLVTEHGYTPDDWQTVDDEAPLPTAGKVVVPPARLDEALAVERLRVGVDVAGGVPLGNLLRRLTRIDLVRLRFDSFSDGRGFSLARQLREAGFEGQLRAAGHIIADQWPLLRDCGIDEVELDDALASRQPAASWREAAGAIVGSYQRRVTLPAVRPEPFAQP